MLIVHDPEQCLHRLQFVVRWLSLDELDDSAADTPYIRGGGCTRQLNNFWCHPVWRTNYARLVQARLLGSHTEVGQLDQTLLGGQDVCTFDIPVNDTLLVQVEETVKDLGHVQCDEVFGELAKVLADAV